jgi:N-6 DNA Methylase
LTEIIANERTFQGILWNKVNELLKDEKEITFSHIHQESNIGVEGSARFADGLLYSEKDVTKKVLFELKDTNWDATDERLVFDASMKAFNRGFEYFVTGTPRQLVIYRTFQENTTLNERKLKIYDISTIRKNSEFTTTTYYKQITQPLKIFLKDLSDIVHDVKEVQWDTIDKFFVKKLSAYILEGSAEMTDLMFERIKKDKEFRKRLKDYLKDQDIFNITLKFDGEEVYKICQLANYLLYLKIIFYSYLQREVPKLNLEPLEIPEDKNKLNKVLRNRFNDVLKYDFELIFQGNILDEFEYTDKYIPGLKYNVNQISELNFHDLNVDIMGAIYNTLIDNQEQHDRGQHFTNVNEVDIVNEFCIKKDTKLVLDSGCGAGTFLVRAYKSFKHHNPKLRHEELLERLWGIEIAPFPAFLATMNLSLLDLKVTENYPAIIRRDFSEIRNTSSQKLIFLNTSLLFDVKDVGGKIKRVKIPVFDTCIGNPPYIRQELIEHKKRWIDLAKSEYDLKKINMQSDLYIYYLMHTTAFLKEGGRLGYVISSSWLDVSFGGFFQKFLLDHFKIIAIIDNQKVRSFETASINTVILIIEKCSERKLRKENKVKFVRIFKEYDELIGSSNDANRFDALRKFVQRIEKTNKLNKDDDLMITVRKQKELEDESTTDGKYENGNWGAKYLRSPDIFNKIIDKAGDKLIPLRHVCEVKYGIKTGANEFFYVKDETEKVKTLTPDEYRVHFGHRIENSKINWEKHGWYFSEMNNQHYLMERNYFKPLFKSQKEASNLDVDLKNLKYHVLICNNQKSMLRKYKVKLLKYIEDAEKAPYKFNERATCAARIKSDGTQDWFNLGDELFVGDFIFPSKIGERFRLIDNRETGIYCDKVNYNIKVKQENEKYKDIIFLILNSTIFRYFLDLFSRQMVVKVSDVDVNVVEKTLIINPALLKKMSKELKFVYKSLKARKQETIYEEVKKEDRRKLDEIIFNELKLGMKSVDELYKESCQYVLDRKNKSESLITSKTKQKIDYETSLRLVADRFDEINEYKNLIKGVPEREFTIPNIEPQFPKNLTGGDSNLFALYKVKFKDGNKETIISFDNNNQILLFKFLYDKLEIKGTKISLPRSPEDCNKILRTLKHDFEKYSSQIKAMLKTYRSKAHYISIYRDLVMRRDI